MITPDVTEEVVATYRMAARRHRRQAVIERAAGRYDIEATERRAFERLERAITVERTNPEPK